jgi:hypothetical protein
LWVPAADTETELEMKRQPEMMGHEAGKGGG